MFTWVCPQCGREVPPAYNDCPDCTAKTAEGAAPAQASLDPTQPPAFAAPQDASPALRPRQPASPMFQASPPEPPRYAPPRPAGSHLPTWLMALFFAIGLVGLGGGILWYVGYQRTQKPSATVESPAAKPGASQNPLQKFIEVTGVRFGKSSKGLTVTFVLVNHSESDLIGLAGNVTIWGRTQKSEEDAVGTFTFQLSMPAGSSKELNMPLTTKLKIIEMPDWQNVTVDVQITAPPAA